MLKFCILLHFVRSTHSNSVKKKKRVLLYSSSFTTYLLLVPYVHFGIYNENVSSSYNWRFFGNKSQSIFNAKFIDKLIWCIILIVWRLCIIYSSLWYSSHHFWTGGCVSRRLQLLHRSERWLMDLLRGQLATEAHYFCRERTMRVFTQLR